MKKKFVFITHANEGKESCPARVVWFYFKEMPFSDPSNPTLWNERCNHMMLKVDYLKSYSARISRLENGSEKTWFLTDAFPTVDETLRNNGSFPCSK